MEEKQKKILNWVFLGVMIAGLVLIIVGMFLDFAHSDTLNVTYKLTSDEWDMHEMMLTRINAIATATGKQKMIAYEVSSTYVIISFVIALVGTALLILNHVLKNVLHKKIKILGVLALLITLGGAGYIIGSCFGLVSNLDHLYWWSTAPVEKWGNTPDLFSVGAAAYVGLVGGILVVIAGIASMLKVFKD